MVRGQAPGEGAVIKRDRNGGGERLSGGQSAGYLPSRPIVTARTAPEPTSPRNWE
jgi:hypothetical protein